MRSAGRCKPSRIRPPYNVKPDDCVKAAAISEATGEMVESFRVGSG